MFKVQNTKPGHLSIDLEPTLKGKGRSISITSGGYLDLDRYCTRKWIQSNTQLRKYLASGTLRLIHDSEVGVHTPTIGVPVRQLPEVEPPLKKHQLKRIVSETPAELDPPEVIDLSEAAPKSKVLPITPTLLPLVPMETTPSDSVLVEEPLTTTNYINVDPVEEELENKPRRRGRPRKKSKELEDVE